MLPHAMSLDEKRSLIIESLSELLEPQDQEDGYIDFERYIVFKSMSTEDFVQFFVTDNNVALDLPTLALTQEQEAQVWGYFKSAGLDAFVVEAKEKGVNGVDYIIFQLPFGKNIQRAAEVTLDVFRLVYQLPRTFVLDAEFI
jgi:hypothetical protein